jgi:glycosyltransferase involved in cell wall biosynthesis
LELIKSQSNVQNVEPLIERKKIALVVPAFNESRNLLEFFKEAKNAAANLDSYNWEFIFVNDGSSDNTWEIIEEMACTDPRVKGVSLSRNFGKEVSLTAGLEAVTDADAVIFIDADLQHPPSLIAQLVTQWECGYQIVATQRKAIKYSLLREAGSRLFYFMLKNYSDLEIHPKATDFRLLDKEVLEILKTFEERTRFFRGLIDWMGFRKTIVTFSAPDRAQGESTFNLGSLVRMAVNSFTTFSLLPLRITGWLGLTVVSMSLAVLFFMIITQFFFSQVFTPLAYFVVFNTLLFGVVLAALGLIALYIGHIHTEVIRRPLYIVQDKVGFKEDE